MAGYKGNNAWVVMVSHDNELKSALLSGNMIRKSGTTAHVVAMVSSTVTNETMNGLTKVYDMVVVEKTFTTTDFCLMDFKEKFLLDALTLRAFSKLVVVMAGVVLFKGRADDLLECEATNKMILVDEKETTIMALISPDVIKYEKIINSIKLENKKTRVNFRDLIFENHQLAKPRVLKLCKNEFDIFEATINEGIGITYMTEKEAAKLYMELCRNKKEEMKMEIPFNVDESNWVAIVGMSCRFPEANSIDEYWELFVNGRNTCGTVPAERTKLVDMDPTIKANFLKCPVDQFDAQFFGFSPTEASFTDPQARLLLECSWEALEDAGIDPNALRGTKAGIFHGSWMQEYKEAMNENCSAPSQDFIRKYLGNGFGSTAAKLSFFYGTTGPNLSTESGCSSSMIAIDMASKSLQRNECTMALTCGANLILHLSKQNFVWSEDGKSKTFDTGANGYARAEGIAVLVLKRYSEALLDNDIIHGIIRGTGTSQEGLSKSFGTPTVQSEYDSMRKALVAAKVTPAQVDYVEAHATGTAVGDPIEAAAIVKAYQLSGSSKRESPLIIGSGKTNVGHTESCSGMAGIIKVLLSMKHELIPKHVNFTRINPQIDFTPIPGIIPLEPIPWPRKSNGRPRIAGVSSFGITGTDVHVIIQEPPIKEECQNKNYSSHPQILTLSAKSNFSLEQLTKQYLTRLEAITNQRNFEDITYTSNTCRAHNRIRRAIIGSNKSEMLENIRTGHHMYTSNNETSLSRNVCFSFPGLIGKMSLEQIRKLYQTIPYFKDTMDSCDQIFKLAFSGSSALVEMLMKGTMETPNIPKGVEWYALLLCFQFSLSKLWIHWGIIPNLVIGHCFGEFTAAVICGALDLKDALEMIKMMPLFLQSQSINPASMIAINSNRQTVENLIEDFFQNCRNPSDWIDIAVINSDSQTVLVGPPETIQAFQKYCVLKDIKVKSVPGDFCPHSRAVENACQKSLKTLNKVIHHPIKIPFISSLTGKLVKDSDLNGMFWYRVQRNSVDFKYACQSAMKTQLADVFIEIGLDASLTKFTKDNLKDHQTSINCLPSFPRKEYGIFNTLAEMYALGMNVNWSNFHGYERRNKVRLPHYPFQRKSFWFERRSRSQIQLNSLKVVHPLLGSYIGVPPLFGNFAVFRNDNFLTGNNLTSFLYDHIIGNQVIFPGAGFLEMMLSSWKLAMKLENISSHSVEKFTIHEPMPLDKSSTVSIVSVINKDNGNISIYTTNESQWKLHATAAVIKSNLKTPAYQLEHVMKDIINTENVNDMNEESANEFYLNAAKVGLNFGPTFKSIKRIYKTGNGDTLAEVKDLCQPVDSFCCHPIFMDSMIQGFMVHTKPSLTSLYVPIKINKFEVVSTSPLSVNRKYFVHCQNGSTTVTLFDETGQMVAIMRSPDLVATTAENLLAAAAKNPENPLSNSIRVYDTYWKQAKYYQPSPVFLERSETLEVEYQNELSKLQKKQNRWNSFSEEEIQLDETMNHLCYLYVVKALFEFGWDQNLGLNIFKEDGEWGILPGLVRAFHHLLSYVRGNEQTIKETTVEQIEHKIKTILDLPLVKGYKAMKTIHECGRNLARILKGIVDPHQLLFGEENLAEHYYQTSRLCVKPRGSQEMLFTFFANKWATGLNAERSLQILEIGAGTARFPKQIIPVLQKMEIKFHYHFTDISKTLVSRAKEMFGSDSQDLSFKVLNIEMDPLKQGFPPGYFDIVVAIDVLHATRNLHETLRNIQMVTKLGGVLLLGETEKPVREIDICFGGLDGYWLFEDNIRKDHCTINSDTWISIMAENGFSGSPCKVLCCEGQISIISSSKTDDKLKNATKSSEWVVFEFENGAFRKYKPFLESVTNRNYNSFFLDPKLSAEELHGYLNECLRDDIEGILVWMCPSTSITCDQSARVILEPLLYISKSLQQTKLKTLPKFHLVTEDCWDLPPPINLTEFNTLGPSLAQAWGFMRSARIELPRILSKSIDLEISSAIQDKVVQLATEMWLDDQETEVVYRQGARYVSRLKENTIRRELTDIPDAGMFRVELPKSKTVCNIKFVETNETEQLKQQQVKVEVRSVALNFKDVLAVLKPSSEFDNLTSIGFDFSGVVTDIGTDVVRWQVGDEVFGFKCDEGCMRSHLITNENLVIPIPSSATFTEAATLPTVFATAWHCMVNIAKLEKGQTMLLHAASGGVGLVAIQIAKVLGVNVIGTAGSEKKRRFVRRLGVEHVFSSRTLDFKNEITKITIGQGVDMVLNCLTGPGFKESSLAVCRDGGHFVEISKLDIWSAAEVEEIRPKINYTIVDLTTEDDLVIEPIVEKLSEMLIQGNIRPLHHKAFPANYLSHALSYLQKAKHIGKVVINMPINHFGERKTCIFNDRSTYLITGGKTGIGFAVCKWMVREQGAKYFVLVSRSPPNENVKREIMNLENQFGATIICKEIDVSDYSQCKSLIEHDFKDLPPLRGVHHCAAILSDQLISNQDWSNFERVISPKAGGAWNLHHLTMEIPLEHFVMYSSAVSVFGNVGQTNYACANAYLDNLALLRTSMGLPALSINWGQWKAGLAENVEMVSFNPFSIEEGIQALSYFMHSNNEQQNMIVAGNVLFPGILKLAPYFRNTFLEDIVTSSSVSGQNEGVQPIESSSVKAVTLSLASQIKQCTDLHTKENVVKNFVLQTLCDTLGTSKDDIKDNAKFIDMGMDSLMSIEFTNKINSALEEITTDYDGVRGDLSIQLDLEENGTLIQLTTFILKSLE